MKRYVLTIALAFVSCGFGVASAANSKDYEAVESSQKGWRLKTDKIDLFITKNGAHMAPVRFEIDTKNPVQPYYISPWQNDKPKDLPVPVLVPLRGDFFCMPFGGNAEEVNGEKHTPHGETATSTWKFVDVSKSSGVTTLTLSLKTKVRKGKTTKKIFLLDKQNVIYSTHILEGYSGKMPIGQHCTLDLPEKEGSLRVATSSFALGLTNPILFSNPVNREYQSLAINAKFSDLSRVPVLFKDAPPADCTSFPQRTGYTDLLEIFRKPSKTPAWTTATVESRGYLWFSLKDATTLPGTVFWIANKGRHGFPWNGRNRCLGLEETNAYFAEGLGPSVKPNAVTRAGFPTAIELSSNKPTLIHFIQGAVHLPPGFKQVKEAKFSPGKVTFISTTGKQVSVDVKHEFLKTGKL